MGCGSLTEAVVRGAADFDTDRLANYLSGQFGPSGGTYALERIGGGQSNPTYFLDWGTHRLVLRKKPNGSVLKGAHAVEREYRVLSALAGSRVPVPNTVLLEEDQDILGTPFYLMQRVEGRVFDDPSLPDVSPDQRHAIWLSAAETLAKLHRIDPEEVGLSGFGRPGNYFQRQIDLWGKQYAASPSRPIAAIETLHDWLAQNMPSDDGASAICHGDFRIGNLIFHATEPRVVAVLDWELSTLGHPMADLGFVCMAWHTSPDEYGGLLGLDYAALGLPSETVFLEHYQKHLGRPVDLTPFHRAFALFRFAVIFVGIADRASAGTASDPKAASLAPLAERFALRALELR